MGFDDKLLLKTSRFNVVQRQGASRDGKTFTRDIILHVGSVAIVPLVNDQKVCLIRNQRLAVGQTLWEIPAGTRELGESPEKTAERELQEETGYVAGKWAKIGELLLSPGILNERMYVYVAEELRQGNQNLEQGEEIETHVLAWDTALKMIDRGDIVDAKTISALLMWDRTGATNHGT